MQAAVDSSAGTLAARAVAVSKVYGHGPGAVTALDGVTVGIQAGTFTAVMGPSGGWPRPRQRCPSTDPDRVVPAGVEVRPVPR